MILKIYITNNIKKAEKTTPKKRFFTSQTDTFLKQKKCKVKE